MNNRGEGSVPAGCLGLACLLALALCLPAPLAAQDKPAAALTPEQQRLKQRADALNGQAVQLHRQGRYAESTRLLQEALQLRQRLYPPDKYPQGHPDLAMSLNNLALVLKDQGEYGKALPYAEQAVAVCRRLYPKEKFPRGHPGLAISVNNLGILLQARGDLDKALPCFEEALALRQRLYPRERFPQGHPAVAASLNNLGMLLRARGDLDQALRYHEQALTMKERLYPKEKFPDGNDDLAISLNNVGMLLHARGETDKAVPHLERALAMRRRLYPKDRYPQGHPDLAMSLSNLGVLFGARAEYGRALPCYEEALAMRRRLYPPERYPRGHPDLAGSLNNLGFLLRAQGEYGKAQPYLEQALDKKERLYPRNQYPRGHAQLALALDNLALVLWDQKEYDKALPYSERALAMRRRLYPEDRYPQGHPDLTLSLNNLGLLLADRGEYGRALPFLEQALAMKERLYPKERYPRGHPDLAAGLSNLGSVWQARGDYDKALPYCEKAVAMQERLHPRDRYPRGHPRLAGSLNNLGYLLHARGEHARALPYLDRALTAYEALAEDFLATASEAEALNRLAQFPFTRDVYLSAALHVPESEAAAYAHLWRGKAAVARVMGRRHQALALTTDPACADLARELMGARQALGRLLLAPPGSVPNDRERVQQLTDRKESLERELARKVPAFKELQERDRLGHADLLKRLPPRTGFVDFLRYYRIEHDPKVPGDAGRKWTASYLAFVLRPGQPVRRVELGPAQAVEDALHRWRRDIQADRPGDADAALRQRLWAPLAEHLPADTEAVFLAPDGELAALPWAALPGAKPGTVLLEEHFTLALVPHGRFLLDRLLTAAPAERDAGLLLAVGAVQYDKAPRPVANPGAPTAPAVDPELDAKAVLYRGLPGTEQELRQVLTQAGRRATLTRRGTEAGSARLLLDLPRARWAHLATHGFFADRRFRSALQVDENDYKGGFDRVRGYRERVGAAARNPLVLSGLVLAGANVPGVDGVLTAEAIAGLPLAKLDLVVLSANETGLGDVAGGEGAFGLQRAFHIAGARNVVASLWRADDDASAALAALFYRKLWQEGQAPPRALKEAQLALYRHPECIPALAQARGPDFDREVRRAEGPAKPGAAERAGVRRWAGFVASGVGR